MTTIPTPLFIVLLCLSLPTVCGILAVLAVVYMIARFSWEEKQRAKGENEQAIQYVEMYLRKNGGKKWPTIH